MRSVFYAIMGGRRVGGRWAHHADCELAVGIHDARAQELREPCAAVERELMAVCVDRALSPDPLSEGDG